MKALRPTGVFAVGAALAQGGCTDRVRPETLRTQPFPLVFLLMGQSNMSGRGVLAEVPGGALDPDARIYMFGNDGAVAGAREPVDSALNQKDGVSADLAAGVGPGLAFAKQLVRIDPDRRIILVPCAKGGSAIRAWQRNQAASSLYGSCLNRARHVAGSGHVAGVLWYQGESDAESPELVRRWPVAFKRLVQDLRRDLRTPRLPVAMVAIGDRPTEGVYGKRFPEWRAMQRAQTKIEGRCIARVTAAGLPRNIDGLHLSTAAQIELGRSLAAAWEALNDRCRR
jgi:hypothetical protein